MTPASKNRHTRILGTYTHWPHGGTRLAPRAQTDTHTRYTRGHCTQNASYPGSLAWVCPLGSDLVTLKRNVLDTHQAGVVPPPTTTTTITTTTRRAHTSSRRKKENPAPECVTQACARTFAQVTAPKRAHASETEKKRQSHVLLPRHTPTGKKNAIVSLVIITTVTRTLRIGDNSYPS